MRYIKSHALCVAIFVGQLVLTGCDTGFSNGRKSASKGAFSYSKTFEEGNKNPNLWGANAGRDWEMVTSRQNFQIKNDTGYPISSAGCDGVIPQVNTQHFEDLNAYGLVKVNSAALIAHGYPMYVLDPANFKTHNYIEFNKVPSEKFTRKIYCPINIDTPDGRMSIDMEVDIDTVPTNYNINQILTGINDAYKKETTQNQWHGNVGYNKVMGLIADKVWRGVSISSKKKAFNDTLTDTLNNQLRQFIAFAKEGKLKEANAFLEQTRLKSINGLSLNERTIKDFTVDSALTQNGYKVYINDLYVDPKGKFIAKLNTIDDVNAVGRLQDVHLPELNQEYKGVKPQMMADDLLRETGSSPDTLFSSKNFSEVSGNDFLQNLVRSQDIINNLALHVIVNKAAGKFRIVNHWVELAISASSFLKMSDVISEIASIILNHYTTPSQGTVYGTTVVSMKFIPVTEDRAREHNEKYKSNPDKIIYANTKQVSNLFNSAHHNSTFTFKDKVGYNSQFAVVLDAVVTSQPQHRTISDDLGKPFDPFLGGNPNGVMVDDAVLQVSLSRDAIDDPTNKMDDLRRETMKEAGFDSLASPLLPSPVYEVSKITDMKTKKVLFSNHDNYNHNLTGKINGITINHDELVDMQVKIPKENSGDLYGLGFMVRYIEEDAHGAHQVAMVQSNYAEDLLKKSLTNSDGVMRQPYFYSNFTCSYPPKIGENCNLKLYIGGMDNDKRMGKIYIADGASRTTAIPIYLNYHLLGSPDHLYVNKKEGVYKIHFKNTHNEDYTKIDLKYKSVDDNDDDYDSIPKDVMVSSDCNRLMEYNDECTFTFDFRNSNIVSDSYVFRASGIKATTQEGTVPEPDLFDFTVSIN